MRLRKQFDVVIAVESPNAFTALMLRFLRLSRTIVYDMIDYSPNRFKNRWLNKLFHWLDRWAVTRCDWVWNQTELVAKERFKRGVKPEKCAPQLVKPTGILPEKITLRPIDQIKRHQLVYMGSFLERDGVEMLLEAFIQVVRDVPQANLVLIGEGELQPKLKQLVEDSHIEENCQFLGLIEDEKKLEKILLESAFGVAPYSDEQGTVKLFNDVSKPKVYLSCGLPVVITRVPLVAEEIESRGAGIAVAYESPALAQAIKTLLTDEPFFKRSRQKAHEMAKDYSWDKIYDRLMKPIQEKLV